MLDIKDVTIRKMESDGNNGGNLLAYATVNFGNCFVVHNIKLIDGTEGQYIAMPRRKTGTGEYKDVVHPINSEFRKFLQEAVIGAYKGAV